MPALLPRGPARPRRPAPPPLRRGRPPGRTGRALVVDDDLRGLRLGEGGRRPLRLDGPAPAQRERLPVYYGGVRSAGGAPPRGSGPPPAADAGGVGPAQAGHPRRRRGRVRRLAIEGAPRRGRRPGRASRRRRARVPGGRPPGRPGPVAVLVGQGAHGRHPLRRRGDGGVHPARAHRRAEGQGLRVRRRRRRRRTGRGRRRRGGRRPPPRGEEVRERLRVAAEGEARRTEEALAGGGHVV
mmetsp:Transcript_16012/g.35334  ORF Transcript_16012/g.35334 Transcript_16012/m.35334 type:complete len:240 (+) Transcript_16012:447-1166(+)